MSGKRGDLLLALCMLSLVALGATMPQAVSALQDRTLEAQADPRALSDVQLVLHKENDVGRVLALVGGDCTVLELNGGARRTVQEAEQAGKEAAERLIEQGLLAGAAFREEAAEAKSYLAVSNTDGGASATFWRYSWTTTDKIDGRLMTFTGILLIDDITGMLVGARLGPRDADTAYAVTSEEWATARVAGWAEFCQSYYGYKVLEIETELNDGLTGVFKLRLTEPSEEGENIAISYELHLVVQGDSIAFNY